MYNGNVVQLVIAAVYRTTVSAMPRPKCEFAGSSWDERAELSLYVVTIVRREGRKGRPHGSAHPLLVL